MCSPPNNYENCFVILMKIFNIYQTYFPLLWKKNIWTCLYRKIPMFCTNLQHKLWIEGLFEIQFLVDSCQMNWQWQVEFFNPKDFICIIYLNVSFYLAVPCKAGILCIVASRDANMQKFIIENLTMRLEIFKYTCHD
jgi:hypothetical protein